jgi:hypothetical protein
MAKEIVSLPWYQQPIGLGLLGLMLMIGGWKLASFLPLSPREQEQADKLAELRGMSSDSELARKLDRLADHVRREPPYRFPGRLVLLLGLALFLVAGARMYRSKPSAEQETVVHEEVTPGSP